MKAYELLKDIYEDKTFTDGINKFKIIRSFNGDLNLFCETDNYNNPYKLTAREMIELDFNPSAVGFIEAIRSEKDIYIKHSLFNKYEDDYLPLNLIFKRMSSFNPSEIKDIFANGEWYIKIN